MTAGYYTSCAPDGLHRGLRARLTRLQTQWVLSKHGVRFRFGIFADALPQLHFTDLRRPKVEVSDFAGKIVLGDDCCLISAGVSPFPAGPVRLTVIRWGDAPDDCGQIVCNSRLIGTSIVSMAKVTIGNRVRFAPQVVIMDTDGHVIDPADRHADAGVPQALPIVIEDDVWVGYGATILKGVTLGKGAVVGAGSIVTKSVPAHTIVVGNPAKPVGSRPVSLTNIAS